MKATSLKPGDQIVAKYDPQASRRQPAGRRVGDRVQRGAFVPVTGTRIVHLVAPSSLEGRVHLHLRGQQPFSIPADTVFEVIRNGEVL